MTLLEETNAKFNEKNEVELKIKTALKNCIKQYSEMVGWKNKRAHFTSTDLKYLLLKHNSGWTQHSDPSSLLFNEVMSAVEFIQDFLCTEGFVVTSSCSSYGVELIISWENK